MNSITLNEDQELLFQKMKQWWFDINHGTAKRNYFVYAGSAGTGKTTVMREFIKEIGLNDKEYVCAALIGKAVLVMQRKGLPARTIHSLIYSSQPYTFTDERGIEKTIFKFTLKEKLPDNIELLIVDETSFIDIKTEEDILSFDIPVIFCGDLNQLPPVFGHCRLLDHPDHVLHQLMRQSEDDMIVKFAHALLNGKHIPYGEYKNCRMLDKIQAGYNLLKDYDIIICNGNKVRDLINDYIRSEVLTIKGNFKLPHIGEKLICRENVWDEIVDGFSLTNGTIGSVIDLEFPPKRSKGAFTFVDFKPDYFKKGSKFRDLKIDLHYLNAPYSERREFGFSKTTIKFEYGYNITTYLSQGSEYNRVLFINDPNYWGEKQCKSGYTAATRAIRSLDVIDLPGLLTDPDLNEFNQRHRSVII